MQLILDADNIDIERNMSTIEQEPLNEKFLTNKVIDRLTDDITTGNKENIQKPENIILDKGEENVNDTEKETVTSVDEIFTSNSNKKGPNDNGTDTEDLQIPEEINKDKKDLKEISNDLINHVGNEVSLPEQNKEKTKEFNSIDDVETKSGADNETEIVLNDKISTVEDATSKENDMEKITESNTTQEVMETSTEVNEENENVLDKEVDISELSVELNEEKEMDLDKEVDISDLSTEINEENSIDLDETVDTTTENVEKKSAPIDIPNTSLDEKNEEMDCSVIDTVDIVETNEKNIAIEIDDEDEKTTEKTSTSDEKVQEILSNVSEQAESIKETNTKAQEDPANKNGEKQIEQPKRICRLSNNLDILSDDEDDRPNDVQPSVHSQPLTDKQCINIDDDDDIMLIQEDSSTKESKSKDSSLEVDTNSVKSNNQSVTENINQPKIENKADTESNKSETNEETSPSETENKDVIPPVVEATDIPVNETKVDEDKPEVTNKVKKPLLPKNFIHTCKKNLADMTRNDLEEFCILKIVESIVDRSNLGEIKAHLKNLTQTMEDCKKKCLMLTKQNKDLQIVLKAVQEEQKSGSDVHITPLKITRSVGMQVVMVADKVNQRKKTINGSGSQASASNNTKQVKNLAQNARTVKEKPTTNQQIPVPRLVPATSPAKTNQTTPNAASPKQANNTALPNGMRNSPPVPKGAEKRTRSQAVTVDLTDDEPPSKIQNVQRGVTNPSMRVPTPGTNIIPSQRFNQNINSPRKVYIPISGPQAQNIRPGQTIMLKTLPGLGSRPRAQAQALITKSPQTPNVVRIGRGLPNRHPAPLPDAIKQYQPPNWKALPPAPDLKLSKVENGIVISWKIDGYQEENHEEIASYQLYAYQETSSPPNTALWKKIGDVKALPLPMACTLTQFMAGYKYYFAVRAVDIRSRYGPFSLPGSILLLNKV